MLGKRKKVSQNFKAKKFDSLVAMEKQKFLYMYKDAVKEVFYTT